TDASAPVAAGPPPSVTSRPHWTMWSSSAGNTPSSRSTTRSWWGTAPARSGRWRAAAAPASTRARSVTSPTSARTDARAVPAHTPRKSRPTPVASLAGPRDRPSAATHGDDRLGTVRGGTPEEIPARYTSVDPIQNIDPNIPVVAVHGTVDTMVSPENSERYIAAVKQQNGIGDLVLADGEDHVSLVSGDSAHYQQILDIIVNTSTTSVGELEQQHAG